MNSTWQQKILRGFCKEKDIHITAYSSLDANNTAWGDNRGLESDILDPIAKAKGKTTLTLKKRVHRLRIFLIFV